jgi:ADP-ribose pyrophosphatase YjhB (NUDIX family)
MTKPEKKTMPDDLWKGMVRHGVTPSLNLLINDGNGAFLFLLRANEPAKGQWWVPGGRIRNGETKLHAVHRLAREEIGLEPESYDLRHISDRHNEEIFHVKHMDAEHALKRYGEGIDHVHYWGGAAYMTLKPGMAPNIVLDDQSSDWAWLKELPANPHEYLVWYFRVMADAGYPVLPLPETA